jgi:hypothetical protein
MKTSIVLILLSIAWLIGLVSELSGATVAKFHEDQGLWSYAYEVPAKLEKHDISHVSVTVPCPEAIFDHYSEYRYKPEFTKGLFKFDDLKRRGDDLPIFVLLSPNPLTDGTITVKAGRIVDAQATLVPSCIPEPRTYAFVIIAGVILILRRKRT